MEENTPLKLFKDFCITVGIKREILKSFALLMGLRENHPLFGFFKHFENFQANIIQAGGNSWYAWILTSSFSKTSRYEGEIHA